MDDDTITISHSPSDPIAERVDQSTQLIAQLGALKSKDGQLLTAGLALLDAVIESIKPPPPPPALVGLRGGRDKSTL